MILSPSDFPGQGEGWPEFKQTLETTSFCRNTTGNMAECQMVPVIGPMRPGIESASQWESQSIIVTVGTQQEAVQHYREVQNLLNQQ